MESIICRPSLYWNFFGQRPNFKRCLVRPIHLGLLSLRLPCATPFSAGRGHWVDGDEKFSDKENHGSSKHAYGGPPKRERNTWNAQLNPII